ncbi:MAG: glycosyltransferase [Bacteroidota bacterium]
MPRRSPQHLYIVGRFPPPLDGQAVATARLATLIEEKAQVARVNVGTPEGSHVEAPGGLRFHRAAHALRLRARLRQALAALPEVPVLWPSISPSPLGHLRDRLTVVPAFTDRQSIVGVVHRGDFRTLFTSPLTRWSGRQIVERLAAVVFLTEALSDACASWIPAAKRVVIPNTISHDVIPDAATVQSKQQEWAVRPPGTPLHLLYLSAMIPSKGYEHVLSATALLRDRNVPVQTTFAGRWESDVAARAFSDRVRQLDLADCVDVRGGVSRNEAGALHLSADVLILPTTYPVEAQPLVVIEAMAAGTPVIVTRHAGLPEMVTENREGRFVAPASPAEIADAALRLRSNWVAFSLAARQRFELAYSPDVVRRQWLQLLDTL